MSVINTNRSAFLTMIAVSEGTAGKGNNGYNIIVGGKTFDSYADHPRVRVWIPRIKNYSTAAGRYQLLARWWKAYKVQLKLHDFSPDSQDAVALQQIKECGALADIDAGRFDEAVTKCRKIWASLPGAGYGQHENTIESLRMAYRQAGGRIRV
jgi:muramidase (phage lysozyme)